MSWDVLYNECQAWELWFFSGSRTPSLWEARRALIAEIYGQLLEGSIKIWQAKKAYGFVRAGN